MPARPQRSAALALFLASLLLCLGFPGFAGIKRKALSTEAQKRKAAKRFPRALVEAGAVLARLNEHIRIPISARLNPLQRVFRIRMNYHLYGGGPHHVNRLEVRADRELLFRSRDPEHAWRQPQLEYRRVKPMVETIALKPDAYNWKGMGRWLVDRVREDRPAAQRIIITSVITHYGVDEPRTRHGRVAAAPEWTLRALEPHERSALDAGEWP